MQNFFVKTHGLGNEYIVLDSSNISFKLTVPIIQRVCNVHYGIGSDGILLKVPSEKADFGVRIYNPDGSEAEKSGNGLRIFSKFLYDYKYTSDKVYTIETLGGIVTAHVVDEYHGKAKTIKVDMGKAIFKSSDIPVTWNQETCFGETLEINGKPFLMHCVSVGNPHCVITKDTLSEAEIKEFGPLIENHPMFPNRINVQFVKVINRSEVEILIWERGAGFTLASGSSSSAVAAAMVKKGLVDGTVTVKMPGGELKLEVDPDYSIRMTGEVKEIASGYLSYELLE